MQLSLQENEAILILNALQERVKKWSDLESSCIDEEIKAKCGDMAANYKAVFDKLEKSYMNK